MLDLKLTQNLSEREVSSLSMIDKWRHYLASVESPEIYIDYGFYYMISAALQRRVWIPFGTQSLYPNMYVIFTGHPAIGKGRVIVPVKEFLEYHIKQNPTYVADDTVDLSKDFGAAAKTKIVEVPLFPTLPDSGSLRRLTSFIAGASAGFKYTDPTTDKTVCSTHCSGAFILEELSNLFKDQKETKDISRFLTCAWDCGNFRHETEHSGCDIIRKMCVALLAGATPDFMRTVVSSDLMNEGFASRTLFIWAERNRWYKFDFGTLTDSQILCRKQILDHLLKLSTIHGPLSFTPDAYAYAKDWYETKHENVKLRINNSYKMSHYYGRKKMHLLKLAMAIHFSDDYSMIIEKSDIERAMDALVPVEENMHKALGGKGRNELAGIAQRILSYISSRAGCTKTDLLFEFAEDVSQIELTEILEFLTVTNQAKSEAVGQKVKYIAIKKS